MQLTSSKSLLRDRPTVPAKKKKRNGKKKKRRFNEIVFFFFSLSFFFFFITDYLLCVLIMGFERFSLFQLPLILVKMY